MRIFLLLIALASMSSCKDLNQLISFNLETIDKMKVFGIPDTVLSDTIIGNESFSVKSEDFSFSSNTKFATNKTKPSNIEDVEAYKLYVTVLRDSMDRDFSFGRDFKFRLIARNQEYELATLDFPEPGKSKYEFQLKQSESEWLSIIRGDDYNFQTDFVLNSSMPDTLRLEYRLTFRLKGMPLE